MLLLRPVGNMFAVPHPAILLWLCSFLGNSSLCPNLRFFKRSGDVPQPMLHRNKKAVPF